MTRLLDNSLEITGCLDCMESAVEEVKTDVAEIKLILGVKL